MWNTDTIYLTLYHKCDYSEAIFVLITSRKVQLFEGTSLKRQKYL